MLARVMVDVAEVLAWSGLAEKAVVTANEIAPSWMRDRALTKMVVPLVQSGCVEEAVAVAGMRRWGACDCVVGCSGHAGSVWIC